MLKCIFLGELEAMVVANSSNFGVPINAGIIFGDYCEELDA
jgi:hypothetical protein